MHTSKLLIGLTLAASIANAQGSKKKPVILAQNSAAPAAVAQADFQSGTPSVTASPATQTSVADAAAAKPVAASKFGVSLSYETVAPVAGLKDKGISETQIEGVGTAGLSYKATETVKLQVTHVYSANINPEADAYTLMDPTIHANVSTSASIMGSKPLTIANRAYIPVSEASKDAGLVTTLRTQTTADWDLNPKITLSAHAQARLSLFNGRGSSADETTNSAIQALGTDSRLRLIFQPSAAYNFSDMLNVYYAPWTDMVTTGHQRGNLTMDQRNHIWQDIGANITAGALTINPVWSTKSRVQRFRRL